MIIVTCYAKFSALIFSERFWVAKPVHDPVLNYLDRPHNRNYLEYYRSNSFLM